MTWAAARCVRTPVTSRSCHAGHQHMKQPCIVHVPAVELAGPEHRSASFRSLRLHPAPAPEIVQQRVLVDPQALQLLMHAPARFEQGITL